MSKRHIIVTIIVAGIFSMVLCSLNIGKKEYSYTTSINT